MKQPLRILLHRYGLTIVGVVAVVLLFALLSFGTFLRWRDTEYTGVVTSVQHSTLTLTDPTGTTYLVRWDEHTRIHQGPTTGVTPSVHDVVVIVGTPAPNGSIDARMIGILDSEQQRKRFSPPTQNEPTP